MRTERSGFAKFNPHSPSSRAWAYMKLDSWLRAHGVQYRRDGATWTELAFIAAGDLGNFVTPALIRSTFVLLGRKSAGLSTEDALGTKHGRGVKK